MAKIFWTGTDSLMLIDYSMRRPRKRVYWWLFRRLIRIMDYFIEGHYCDSENIKDNVLTFGTRKWIKVAPDQLKYTEKFPKKEHPVFTILYYLPKGGDVGFRKWLYGYDIFLQVQERFPNLNYIVVDGDDAMRYVYPCVDFYLRPNRHDGASRLRRECEIQDIPYYWTNNWRKAEPSAKDAIESIKKLLW